MQYISFFLKDISFSFVILTVAFTLGWIIYNNLVLTDVSLKDALFSKDNLAVWIEFIGAFVFPVLYLASHSIKGTVTDNILADLGICVIYTIFYVVIFTVLRLISQCIVNLINADDESGKVSLNKEICEQKNVAASLFSVSLAVIFVSIIKYIDFVDIINGLVSTILIKMLLFFVFMLLAVVGYIIVLRRKTTLFKELFIDNNVAAGAALLGYIFAAQTIIAGIISTFSMDFDVLVVSIVTAISLIIFGALFIIFKFIFTKIIKVDIWNEVYEQNNIGAAIGQMALYIGIANIIVNFIS